MSAERKFVKRKRQKKKKEDFVRKTAKGAFNFCGGDAKREKREREMARKQP
jgi:hypothetical protein